MDVLGRMWKKVTSPKGLVIAGVFAAAVAVVRFMPERSLPEEANLCGNGEEYLAELAELELRVNDKIHNIGDICLEQDGHIRNAIADVFVVRTATPTDRTDLEILEDLNVIFDEKEICKEVAKTLEIIDNPDLTDEQRLAQLMKHDGISKEEAKSLLDTPEAERQKARDDVARTCPKPADSFHP